MESKSDLDSGSSDRRPKTDVVEALVGAPHTGGAERQQHSPLSKSVYHPKSASRKELQYGSPPSGFMCVSCLHASVSRKSVVSGHLKDRH